MKKESENPIAIPISQKEKHCARHDTKKFENIAHKK